MTSPVRFAREALTNALWEEARPLLEQHWREIAHYPDIPLNPDRAMYDRVEESGALRFFTAREHWQCSAGLIENGVVTYDEPTDHFLLVGYAVFFVRPNPHYANSVQAVQDVLFVAPSARGRTGAKFIDWCDEQLRAEGVQAVYHHVKQAHNFGPMLERKGYELVDLIYAKRLDR